MMETLRGRFLIAMAALSLGITLGYNLEWRNYPVAECVCGPVNCDCLPPCPCKGKCECGAADCNTQKLRDEVENIYGLIESGNQTSAIMMDTQRRIFHYIAKHDTKGAVNGVCPECTLLINLEKREKEIYDETVSLAAKKDALDPSSFDYVLQVRALESQIKAAEDEYDNVKKYLFRAKNHE